MLLSGKYPVLPIEKGLFVSGLYTMNCGYGAGDAVLNETFLGVLAMVLRLGRETSLLCVLESYCPIAKTKSAFLMGRDISILRNI